MMNSEHNLCMPDDQKACAACCGLYNVADGTRATLLKRLVDRTQRFQRTERSIECLLEFENREKTRENITALDDVIHVCEFVGFVDDDLRTPGCMLHPKAPGNRGIDLRGMCHYGSMACRSFYCPAWEELDPVRKRILVEVIDDWHLYGLVVVDLDFVNSLFGLLELGVGGSIDPERLLSSPAREIFKKMLNWKNSWTSETESTVRKSLYYRKGQCPSPPTSNTALLTTLVRSIASTLDVSLNVTEASSVVQASVAQFRRYYEHGVEPVARGGLQQPTGE